MRQKKFGLAAVLLLATAIILLMITLLVSIFSYICAKRIVQRSYVARYDQVFGWMNQQLSATADRYTQLAASINCNSELTGEINLIRTAASASERLRHERRVKSILKTAVGYQPYIENVGIYLGDLQILLYETESLAYLEDIPTDDWFCEISDGSLSEILLPDCYLKKSGFPDSNTFFSKPYVLYARAFNDTKLSSQRGVLLLSLDQSCMSDLINHAEGTDDTIILLLDEHGHIIFSNQSADTQIQTLLSESHRSLQTGDTLVLNGTPHFLVHQMNASQSWELVSLIPEKIMYNELWRIRRTALSLGVCALVLGLVLVLIITRSITRPFRKLMESMAKNGDGILQPSAVRSPIREVDALAAQYDDMIRQIGALMERNRQIEEEKHLSEIAALKAQINPHFIYNTLDSIRWMALMQNAPHVASMISSLVKLLKLSANQNGRYIRVAEEFEQVFLYTDIIRFRYNCRINVVFDIDEGLENARTLGMLLQPIVENSYIHGFSHFERDGNLRIHAYAEGDRLIFSVQDDGCGVALADGELPETPKRNGVLLHTGIGVSNVNSRIQLSFGEQYGVTFKSTPGVGTTVLLTQPLAFFKDGEAQ